MKMADENRPESRQKHVTEGGGNVARRGSGTGEGPVGAGQITPGQGSSGNGSGSSSGIDPAMIRAVGGGGSVVAVLVAVILILLKMMGGGSGDIPNPGETNGAPVGQNIVTSAPPSGLSSGFYTDGVYFTGENAVPTSAPGEEADHQVAAEARAKRTEILGDGKDLVTLMVYMCGTDLESKNGMASADMAEMAAAKYGDNVRIIIMTGGCSQWKTKGINESMNQIYELKDGGLRNLVQNAGNKSMTDPDNLSSFIRYCAKNYEANRYELILWDHGGGSVSGYGYDEINKSSGSMSLSGIQKALKDGGVTFDFIGFDACLMATAETALMLDDYADYMIASEETEPGIGWYYTNWLTKLGQNTSMDTVDIGKIIVDDFVGTCAVKCRGQKTTLSVVDLAEFSATVPEALKGFSKSVSDRIEKEEYQAVSDARYSTREFATSSKIDQVDLIHLAENMGTAEGRELASAIRSAVKYNRTSDNMTHAGGVSIYFPYKRTSYVDKACKNYDAIGMDSEYATCIRQFAKLEASGQVVQGGTNNPLEALLGNGNASSGSADLFSTLLTGFLANRSSVIDDLDENNTDFFDEDTVSDVSEYLASHTLDASKLVWTKGAEDPEVIALSEEEWALVHEIDLNMFYDDGEGFVDLGLDNVFSYDKDGNLVPEKDKTWVAINGQVVAYYHTDTERTDGVSVYTGYVPAKLNGERVKLILVFDGEHPEGYVAGAVTDYRQNETDTVAKSMIAIRKGDRLDFLCDFYSYDGKFMDSYELGEPLTVNSELTVSNVSVGSGSVRILYRFTDIYNQQFFSEKLDLQ